MPLQQTSGNVTQDAYGGGKAVVPVYVENVFSTYLYTGNNTTNNIVNNIDLSTKGGMLWLKSRSNAGSNIIYDTVRGMTTGNSNYLATNLTNAQSNYGDTVSTTSGFTLGANYPSNINSSGYTEVSWTFRKQPKFFDIVTYTGDGTTSQTISHNLGVAPGIIIVKDLTSSQNWVVYSQSLTTDYSLSLNKTNAAYYDTIYKSFPTTPTSTNFSVGRSGYFGDLNFGSHNYVAYLFAPGGTGGFGLTGTQDIISCGSFAQGSAVTLGWEPQWLLIKDSSNSGDWYIMDNMRGLTASGQYVPYLTADTSSAEGNFGATALCSINATGFNAVGFATGGPYIYIAIRRGPMATPTTATSVFNPVAASSSAPGFQSSNFNSGIDTSWVYYTPGYDDGTNAYTNLQTRLVGLGQLQTPNTRSEVSQSYNKWDYMNGQNSSSYGSSWGAWLFVRAPGFHDVVAYTGTGVTTTQITHNLGVAPQLLIVKSRSNASNWKVYSATVGNGYAMNLNLNSTPGAGAWWNNTDPTSTTFNVNGGSTDLNASGYTYVAYLFATLAGVSKVGSYTGNGTGQSIACGFGASGARYILIKRTDSAGDWYVFDSTNGLTSSSSPYLLLDSTAAQVTGNNGVYASSGGFTLGATAVTTTNIATASYIFLAIA